LKKILTQIIDHLNSFGILSVHAFLYVYAYTSQAGGSRVRFPLSHLDF